MGILAAIRAGIDALDDPWSAAGRAPQEPPAPQTPLGQVVEAISARVVALESTCATLKNFITEEVDRGIRTGEGQRSALRRLIKEFELRYQLEEPTDDVPAADAPRGYGSPVLPMHGPVETSAPPSPEAVRAAARRAVAFDR